MRFRSKPSSRRNCWRNTGPYVHGLLHGGGPLGVFVQIADGGHSSAGQIERGRTGPFGAKTLGQAGEGAAQDRVDGKAGLGVVDARFEDVLESEGAEAGKGCR